jgi:hypothetical protein
VLTFLSDEWVAALDEAAASSTVLAGPIEGLAPGETLVVEHVITSDDGSTGPAEEAAFHLVLGNGAARVHRGRAPGATVTFTHARATARAIASGTTSAQAAFMAGALRLGGRVDLLLAHHAALVDVDDVFATVRDRTDWS